MKFSQEKPQIYDKLQKKFGIEWKNGIIITYGDTVHCKYALDMDKEIHEFIHVQQQLTYGVEKWWNEYIHNKDFRLSQEIEAYKKEKAFVQNSTIDRNKKAQLIDQIYKDISSSNYGRMIGYSEAKKII